MNKNTLIFSLVALSLSACQNYSDEMAFYYEDENAAPDVSAAPTTSVSSKELVIPEDIRMSQQSEDLTISETYSFSEEEEVLPPTDDSSQLSQPLKADASTSKKQTDTESGIIPVAYNDTVTEDVTLSTHETHYDSADITPKVYAIAATRVTNKMLDDTQKLYQQQGNKPKLWVLEAKKMNPKLPDGLYYANKVVYNIIDGSQNFMMVSKLDDADYVLDVSVDAFPNPGIDTPIIVYTLTLQDKDGKKIDSWQQDIRQLRNDDKSWW